MKNFGAEFLGITSDEGRGREFRKEVFSSHGFPLPLCLWLHLPPAFALHNLLGEEEAAARVTYLQRLQETISQEQATALDGKDISEEVFSS